MVVIKPKTKVVFFVTNLDSGGIENYLLRFLDKFSDEFSEVLVFCKSGRGGELENRYVKLKNVRLKKIKVGNFNLLHYLRLYFWFRSHRDYIVCDFTGNFAAPVIAMAKLSCLKKRVVFYRSSSNRFVETKLKLWINAVYNRIVVKSATSILANSNFALSFFFGSQLDRRFKVIFNGVDVEQFVDSQTDLRGELNISSADFVIGHTGRFNPAKNHLTIIETARKIILIHPNVKFILCGRGVMERLKDPIERLGLSNHFYLFDNRDDIPEVLNTCDAYFFPSLTEGQPNSLIEAWIKGIPFVASNIPPIRDIAPVEFHRYLVDPMNSDVQASKLIEIVEGAFGEEDQQNLRNWAKSTFNAELRFLEFYRELIL